MFTESAFPSWLFVIVFFVCFFCRLASNAAVIKDHNVLVLPENKDILLLFVSVGSVKFTDGQVEKWLIVVGCGLVSCVLVETNLPLFEHAEQINPRLAAAGVKG